MKWFVLSVVGVCLVFAVPAQGTSTYTIAGGTWDQMPPMGGPVSMVEAFGTFNGASPSLFSVAAITPISTPPFTGAVPSTMPGYDWETAYEDTGSMMSVGGHMIFVIDSMVNYNNNDVNGMPENFMFVGEGFTVGGEPFHFEAYWDAATEQLDLSNYPQSVGSSFTGGFIEIGAAPAIPEPLTVLGFGFAFVGLGRYIRKRRLA